MLVSDPRWRPVNQLFLFCKLGHPARTIQQGVAVSIQLAAEANVGMPLLRAAHIGARFMELESGEVES
jgi:hypothetical protein